MYQIIGENNRVNYGVIDEPVDFNYKDYRLKDFFGKEIKNRIRKKFSLHMFNFIGITSDNFMLGLACVDLGYAFNIFGYLYEFDKGMVFEFDSKGINISGNFSFPPNPDEYEIYARKGKTFVEIKKSHKMGSLEISADIKSRLKINGNFSYALKTHSPLRVLNPSDPYRWTFTEKCAPLIPDKLDIEFDGKMIELDLNRVSLLYDWSGGYLRRETNWYWLAFSSVLDNRDSTRVGGNFAALVNESFYSENAFWVDHRRTRVSRCIFDFNPSDLSKKWYMKDELGTFEIEFTPCGERSDRFNGILVKTDFRQFIGKINGWLKEDGKHPVQLNGINGLTEFHRVVW